MARNFSLYEKAIERTEFLNENEILLLYLMYRLKQSHPDDEWFGIEWSDIKLVLNISGALYLRNYFDTKFAGILQFADLHNDVIWLKWYPGLCGQVKEIRLHNPIVVILAEHLRRTIHLRDDIKKRPVNTISYLIKHIKRLDAQCMD